MRSSTPATILMLVACILFVLVTCSTPVIKSLSFLDATIGGSGSESGQKATFGALGYCIGNTCKGPTVGYSFNPNQLLGIASSVEGYQINSSKYSTALIKGLTYCLVLNPIALAACVIAFITGVLGHCGDLGLVCLNGVFSSIASTISLIAVALNFVLFVLAKKRIDDIQGASAQYGTALWLSLAGWIVIVLSSCAFCCACGGRDRSGGKNKKNKMQDEDAWNPPLTGARYNGGGNSYGDQMRMDALQAESDRKRRQQNLPKFATYETEHVEELPLKQDYEDSFANHGNGYSTAHTPNAAYGGGGGGYQQHGYGYGYGDDSSYSMHHLGPGGAGQDPTYIAGVGTGAPRNIGSQPQTAAGRYYDPSIPPVESHDNLAGYGAHDLTSPSTTVPSHIGAGQYGGSAIGTPIHPMPDNIQHNSANNGDMDYFYNANQAGSRSAAVEEEGIQSHDAYGGYIGDQKSQNTHNQHQYDHQSQQGGGHAFEYSGATFGAGQQSSSYNHHPQGRTEGSNMLSTQSPYDQIQQATSKPRRLPSVPGSTRGGDEIMFSPTSNSQHEGFGANSVPSPRQMTGDDGFGLAVLQAGAAAAAANTGSSNHSNSYYHHGSDQPPPTYSNENYNQGQSHYTSSHQKF